VPSFLVELTAAEGQGLYAGPELRARLAGANDQEQEQKQKQQASTGKPLLVSAVLGRS
jgi:hypothetical protein